MTLGHENCPLVPPIPVNPIAKDSKKYTYTRAQSACEWCKHKEIGTKLFKEELPLPLMEENYFYVIA